jgi:simple sugar transport system ATP-binding protein
VGTLSGGERQGLAIARALDFGARVLILDEPTAALGVRQAELVLNHVAEVRSRGAAVIFITHNPVHALRVGDRFLVLSRGRLAATRRRGETDEKELAALMAGVTEP